MRVPRAVAPVRTFFVHPARLCSDSGAVSAEVTAEAFHSPSQVLGFLSKCGRQEPERQPFQACVIGGGVMHPLGRVPSWLPGSQHLEEGAASGGSTPKESGNSGSRHSGGDTIFRPLLEQRADSKLYRVRAEPSGNVSPAGLRVGSRVLESL